MAMDIFLKLDGITGTSTDAHFPGQIEVYSVSFDAEQVINLASSSGAGAGKVTLNPLAIMKRADATSPLLFQRLCSGAHFATATLTFRKASASGATPLMTLILKQVLLKSMSTSASSGGDDAPTESLSFVYGALVYTYNAQDASGKAINPAPVGGWNGVTNQADTVTSV